MTIRRFVHCIVLALALSLISAPAQRPAPSATIAAKKPVFAGACKACPWGILAQVTADALKFYGYDTQICWTCATSVGPRQVADKTKPVPRVISESTLPDPTVLPSYYIEPPPEAAPDFGATS